MIYQDLSWVGLSIVVFHAKPNLRITLMPIHEIPPNVRHFKYIWGASDAVWQGERFMK